MTVYTGDGKVLIAWDMGCGPTWAYDPLGKPIKEKFLGTCEVWRSSDGQAAVNLGETSAEAFLDDQIGNLQSVAYWIMENVKGGGQRQIGPVIDVVVPPPRLEPDATPPSPPNELRCRRKSGGNELSWLASVDDESGVLAYFVYSANDHQPDAVLWVNEEDPLGRPAYGEGEDPSEEEAALGETDPVWQLDENGDPIIDEWGNRKAKEHARIKWLDRTTDGKKPYILRAIDNALNLSEPTGRVDPWTGEPAGTLNRDGTPKVREPVEPVVPDAQGGTIGEFCWLSSTHIEEGAEIGHHFNGGMEYAQIIPWGQYPPNVYPGPPWHHGRQEIGYGFAAGDEVTVREDVTIGEGVTLASGYVVAPDTIIPEGAVLP